MIYWKPACYFDTHVVKSPTGTPLPGFTCLCDTDNCNDEVPTFGYEPQLTLSWGTRNVPIINRTPIRCWNSSVNLNWDKNPGETPKFPAIGVTFEDEMCVIDTDGQVLLTETVGANLSEWLMFDGYRDASRRAPTEGILSIGDLDWISRLPGYNGGVYGYQSTIYSFIVRMSCDWTLCNVADLKEMPQSTVKCHGFEGSFCSGHLCVYVQDRLKLTKDDSLTSRGCLWQNDARASGRLEVGEYPFDYLYV
ncbi:unnamed protein product, partial [Mesorhabditis belari]|uniref:Uncharacterized protein n=1 Tax=Mesorhabditis belari TaxID=2138241 RepID=A0AAF3F0S1_9BILA